MTIVLRVENIRKSYGKRTVLEMPALEIGSGAVIYLSGRNGAGKTTLLKILAGLEAPDQATVIRHDQRTSWRQAAPALRREVVYLHQQAFMLDGSVQGNLEYGLKVAGLGRRERRRRVAQALDWLGINDLTRQHARSLSGGERQWVALARAWLLRPRLLLLDEPSANMDLESRERTGFLLRRLMETSMGLIITTHHPDALSALANRHLHLDGGRLREPGAPATPHRIPGPRARTQPVQWGHSL